MELACPCYLFDPKRFRACDRKKFSAISYVKQHLRRTHLHKMEDNNAEDLSDVQDYDTRPVTEAMSKALRAKSDIKLDIAGQWFAVWDIIFPGAPKPLDPYLSVPVPEQLRCYMPYLKQGISSILIPAMIEQRNLFVRVLHSTFPEGKFDMEDYREVGSFFLDFFDRIVSHVDRQTESACPSRQGENTPRQSSHNRSPSGSSTISSGQVPVGPFSQSMVQTIPSSSQVMGPPNHDPLPVTTEVLLPEMPPNPQLFPYSCNNNIARIFVSPPPTSATLQQNTGMNSHGLKNNMPWQGSATKNTPEGD